MMVQGKVELIFWGRWDKGLTSIAREVNCSGQDVFEVCVVEMRGILRGSTAVRCLHKVR